MLAPIYIDRIYVNLWTYVNFTIQIMHVVRAFA